MTPIGSAISTRLRSGYSANLANRTFVFYVVVDELGRHHVLDGLVFHHSELGFLNGQAGQILSLLQSGHDHRLHNAIDVFLGVLRKDGSGGLGLMHQPFQVDNPFVGYGCGRVAHTSHPYPEFSRSKHTVQYPRLSTYLTVRVVTARCETRAGSAEILFLRRNGPASKTSPIRVPGGAEADGGEHSSALNSVGTVSL